MTRVILCDACGKIKKKTHRITIYGVKDHKGTIGLDICVGCFGKLNKILNLKTRNKK